MFSFSLVDDRQDFLLSLKWPPIGVPTGVACFILNLSSIHLAYFSCDNHSFLAFLPWVIFMPRIYHVGPKSFISKVLNKSFLKLPIILASCPTNNISFTYNKRIRIYHQEIFWHTHNDLHLSLCTRDPP